MSISTQTYLNKWSEYAKKDIDWINESPKDFFDFRKRVRRETLRGRTTVFHETIEDYMERQLRAYTTPRALGIALMFISFTLKYYLIARYKFCDNYKYKSIFHNPTYKKLGFAWTSFYLLRPVIFAYLSLRTSIFAYKIMKTRWNGEIDFVFENLFDEAYYDTWFRDIKDLRLTNFRYSDHVDVIPRYSQFNPDIFKADADYYKALYKFFKKGEDNLFEYFTHWNNKH